MSEKVKAALPDDVFKPKNESESYPGTMVNGQAAAEGKATTITSSLASK